MSLIQIRELKKSYKMGKLEFEALKGVDLDIEEGQLVAIVGPSGSGKSTMLNMITGIDRPTGGSVTIAGDRIDQMKEDRLAAWRGANVGIVFQFFQLFPTLTALENVMLPMDFLGRGSVAERKVRARERLELVGLGDKVDNLPSELSGGQQQRVAIARALVNEPKVLIGDEPTGNLDSKTEAAMFELFDELTGRARRSSTSRTARPWPRRPATRWSSSTDSSSRPEGSPHVSTAEEVVEGPLPT